MGSPAVTVIIVAPSVVVLIPIVMQLIFCFALMDEQAYLLQHKILIIFWEVKRQEKLYGYVSSTVKGGPGLSLTLCGHPS